MPELPDLTVVAEELVRRIAGRTILEASAPTPILLRSTPDELEALTGATVGETPTPRQVPSHRARADPMATDGSWLPTRCWPADSGSLRTEPASELAPGSACASMAETSCATWTARCSASSTSLPEERMERDSRLDRDGARCRRPGPDPRGLPRPHPAPPRRAQAAAAQQPIRGRHRQCLQRRDPVGGEARSVPQALDAAARGYRPPLPRHARRPGRRRRTIARPRPAGDRDPAPRVPQGPPARRTAVSPLWARAAPDRRARGDDLLPDHASRRSEAWLTE